MDFRRLFESVPALYLVLDAELTVIAASDAYLAATMTRRDEIVGRFVFDVFPDNVGHPEASGVSNARASFDRVLGTGQPDTMGVQRYDIRGPGPAAEGFEVRYWSPVNTPLLADDGSVAFIVHRVEDVTGLVQLEQLEVGAHRLTTELRERTAQMEADVVLRSREVQEANRKLRLVLDAATDAFIGMDDAGRITDWNPRAEDLFGWSDHEVLGRSLADTIIPPQLRDAHRAGLARFLATGEKRVVDRRVEVTAAGRDGREFPVELAVWAVADGTGPSSFHAFVHDVSERRAYDDALRESETMQRRLADQLADAQQVAGIGSWEWDIPADTVSWSDELCRIFGVEPGEGPTTYEGYLGRVHADDRAAVEAALGIAWETGQPFDFHHRIVLPNDGLRTVHSRGVVVLGGAGAAVRMTGTAHDVTEQVALNQELVALALIDDLTGLHNRRGFVTLADHQIKIAARTGGPLQLLFIDMDGMKTINDTYGHIEGDRALVETATFLHSVMRASDLVARVGGDEFCILMVDDGGSGPLDVDRVLAQLRSGPPAGERSYPLALSVGVAPFEPGSEASVEDLMSRADGAMYADKSVPRRLARVLVVEDDVGLRRLAELGLRSSYDVVTAATGADAVEEAARRLPDLVLLDLHLPDMHGSEVLRRMRAVPGAEHVSVIVMTAAAGTATELDSFREGVDDFVVKPVDLDILEARMKNVLDRASFRPRRLGV